MPSNNSGQPRKKLFALKEWLTVPDAARHLSIIFGEEVSEADVYRLALDGHLTLSVNFVNQTSARRGKAILIEDAQYREVSALALKLFPIKNHRGERVEIMVGINLDGQRVLELEDVVITLTGVYDLLMLGNERNEMEHAFQMLTDGPAITLSSLVGTFVMSDKATIFQLQERIDSIELDLESQAQFDAFKALLDAAPKKAESQKEQVFLIPQGEEQEKSCIGETNPWESKQNSDNYYPAGGLPSNSVIVVRTDALRELEKSLDSASEYGERPLTATERNSLLVIIAALCENSKITIADPKAAGKISGLTDMISTPVTDETVRKVLKLIPDAVGRRKK